MAELTPSTYTVTDADVLKATRQAVAQTMGQDYMEEHGYLESIAVEDLVTIGKDIADIELGTDNFSKAMAKQFGLVVTEALNNQREPMPMELRNIEWGYYIEHALIGDFDVFADPMFNPTKGNGSTYSAFEHDFYNAQTYAKIFDKIQAMVIPISLPMGDGADTTLSVAFANPSQYMSYMGARMQALYNTIESIRYALSHELACAGIAISDKSTQTSVHLLTEAKAEGLLGNTATAKDFLNDADCLAFLMRRIKEVSNNINTKSTAYNNGAMAVRIPKNRQQLCLIENVMSRVESIVKRNSYHEDMLNVDYYPVSSWQAVTDEDGKDFDLSVLTSVKLSADANNTLGYGTSAVNISNCVGLLYAKGSLAYTTYYKTTTVGTTACAGFTTQFHHEAYNMAVNPVLPIVAFIID